MQKLNPQNTMSQTNNPAMLLGVKERSDRLMNYFLIGYFIIGCGFAFFYDTWFIAIGSGSICLLAYYSAKLLLPGSDLYQYVLSVVYGVFMAQFIYQLHGLFEMHFFAFIGSAVLITYQNWKLQIPILIIVMLHHAVFGYLQNAGFSEVRFTQLDYFELSTFVIHISLAAVIFFVCGLWSYQLKKYSELYLQQALHVADLEREAIMTEERLKREAELTALNDMLSRKAHELAISNAELEQFAYVASHDLQEPLRMVTGFLGQINKKYGNLFDDKGKQYMYFAVDGANRMRQIILDLLDYSRVGRMGDKREEVDLNTLTLEITGLFRKQVDELSARIDVDQLPVLNTFRGPVRQIFQNLIGNALKYQQAGNRPIISVSAEDKGCHWKFTVADNGIGIDPAYQQQIFLPFKRLHTREEYPGTGMGLAITKKIIENLGGRITVQSTEGKGSIFSFTLP
jgi:signal transduction histidine kinase